VVPLLFEGAPLDCNGVQHPLMVVRIRADFRRVSLSLPVTGMFPE